MRRGRCGQGVWRQRSDGTTGTDQSAPPTQARRLGEGLDHIPIAPQGARGSEARTPRPRKHGICDFVRCRTVAGPPSCAPVARNFRGERDLGQRIPNPAPPCCKDAHVRRRARYGRDVCRLHQPIPRRSGANTESASTGFRPYTKVKDTSFAHDDVHVRWFEDGTLKRRRQLRRPVTLPPAANQTAIIFEPDDPDDQAQHITYNELAEHVGPLRQRAQGHGRRQGRPRGHLPADDPPRRAYAMLACAPDRRDPFDRLRRLSRPTPLSARIQTVAAPRSSSPRTGAPARRPHHRVEGQT